MGRFEMYGKEQYTNDLNRYIANLQVQLQRLSDTWDAYNCCILSDFEKLQKLLTEAHNLASTYYLQSYLLPFTNESATLSLSTQHLAEKRHGALLVIEREQRTAPFIHNGFPIHAKISHTLLETIFYPGNPLHDGAVLIRQNEIISAGNILPLANTKTKDKKIGTRHRAAIGITEVTDAISIVVSEETGRVSFAVAGELYVVRN